MLWIVPGSIIGMSVLSGMMGGYLISLMLRGVCRTRIWAVEAVLKHDIARIRAELDVIRTDLSTVSVGKDVGKVQEA